MPRILLLIAAAAALAAAAAPSHAAPSTAYARYVAPTSACPSADLAVTNAYVARRTMRCLVNYARRAKGLRPLAVSRQLNHAAALKLRDNVACGVFSHTACGKPFTAVFERAGYTPDGGTWSVGENLAWGQHELGTPRQILAAWLESPAHRANLFDPRWREMGIGFTMPDAFLHVRDDVRLWANTFGFRA